MAAALAPEELAALRAAVAAGDPAVDVYLDVAERRVVRVKDGVCDPEDLDADAVERDEARYAEIPVVTTTDEYLWMQDFAEDYGDRRVASFLDGRKGANARFLKRLVKQTPDAMAAWETYRAGRIEALVEEWLEELGVER